MVFLALLVLIIIGVRWLVTPGERPMFHNRRDRTDRLIASNWVYTPPITDRAGNFAQYDEQLNLFVIVLTHVPDGYSQFFLWGEPDAGRLVILSPAGEKTIATIDRTENRLFVFDLKARTRFEVTIAPGDAMKMRKKADPRDGVTGVVEDLAQALKDELDLHRYPSGATKMQPW